MGLWTRVVNVFRGDGFNRELNEEFEAHMEEAVTAGRDPEEVRRAFGSMLRQREASRRVRVAGWLDGLRADVIFGWRQLRRNRVTSAVAVLSLALAMGACVSAFRLIDALLWRPLPVAHAEQMYAISRAAIGPDGKYFAYDSWEYPLFQQMRTAVRGEAELIAVSYDKRMDVTYGSDEEMERVHLAYVSGNLFEAFGARPVQGRVLTVNDDVVRGAHPYAVISYDYWKRRFGRDPGVVGRRFHMGKEIYEIVGVSAEVFTGTEPGTVTDVFVPATMHPYAAMTDAQPIRILLMVRPGVAGQKATMRPLQDKLQAMAMAFEGERLKGYPAMSEKERENFLNQRLLIEPAASGVSEMQKGYGRALTALGVLVVLVLLIACVNIASLTTAQAAARAREMALRVSIGAGRWRLVRMVLIENALLAFAASALGALLAWRTAPFVVGMVNPTDDPVRLVLPADWRVVGFGLVLTVTVTLLFGLTPALRASAIRPVEALKGGDTSGQRRRVIEWRVAMQIAFCFLVLFFAGLFVATFERLSNEPIGFSAEGVLLLDTVTKRPQPAVYWDQTMEHLRGVPGVESVGLAGFPLMGGPAWNGPIAVAGGPARPEAVYFLNVSPKWMDAMKVQLLTGRDFREGDTYPAKDGVGSAIVNESFAKLYFNGQDPVGKLFERRRAEGGRIPFRIVGLSRDARYLNMREEGLPVAYVPFHFAASKGGIEPIGDGTFVVRTSSAKFVNDPMLLASTLRREVSKAWPAFRVSNVRTQEEIDRGQTVRERLLAMLGVFFAAVAVLLAGIGLYGVLHYSVLQRRKEIGIRVAVGARGGTIVRLVASRVFAMVTVGMAAGAGLGLASARYVESLFFQVKASDASMLVVPSTVILVVALVATVPAVLRALRVDPVEILRAE